MANTVPQLGSRVKVEIEIEVDESKLIQGSPVVGGWAKDSKGNKTYVAWIPAEACTVIE